MTETVKLYCQLKDSVSQLLARQGYLDQQISDLDSYEQRILHFLEVGKMDAASGSKLIKKLKESRSVRRQIKIERSSTDAIIDKLRTGKIIGYDLKIAKPKIKEESLECLLNYEIPRITT